MVMFKCGETVLFLFASVPAFIFFPACNSDYFSELRPLFQIC